MDMGACVFNIIGFLAYGTPIVSARVQVVELTAAWYDRNQNAWCSPVARGSKSWRLRLRGRRAHPLSRPNGIADWHCKVAWLSKWSHVRSMKDGSWANLSGSFLEAKSWILPLFVHMQIVKMCVFRWCMCDKVTQPWPSWSLTHPLWAVWYGRHHQKYHTEPCKCEYWCMREKDRVATVHSINRNYLAVSIERWRPLRCKESARRNCRGGETFLS